MTPFLADCPADPLDARQHQHLRLDDSQADLGPTQRRQQLVPLALPELAQAALDYPLLFLPQAGHLVLCAVVGLDDSGNLFVDEHGHWDAERWLPVQLSQGPFTLQTRPPAPALPSGVAARSAFATDPLPPAWPSQAPALHLHLDHPRLSLERGMPLYLPGGQEGSRLTELRALQAEFQAGVRAATALAGRLHQLGLLQLGRLPYAAEQPGSSVQGNLPQAWQVNEHRLAALDAATLHRLMVSGDLALAQAMALSLQHLPRLAHRLLRRSAASSSPSLAQTLPTGVLQMPPRRRASDLHPPSRAPRPQDPQAPVYAAQA